MVKTSCRHETKKLGTSQEGRAINITFFPEASEGLLLNTLFIGAFHGDERIAGELMEKFREFLISQITLEKIGLPPNFLDQQPFAILPILNPDGFAHNTRQNGNGVDLNRNFGAENWEEENKGTMYYSGPTACSEIETKIVTDLIKTYKPAKIISLHSPYKVINFDGPALGLAEAMAKENGYPVVDDIGYATPGSFGTYAGKELNIPVITLELPEDDPLDTIWETNRNALLEALKYKI